MLRRAAFVAVGIAVVVACGSDYDSQDDTTQDAGVDATRPPSGTSSGSTATDSGPGVFKEQEDLACEGRTANDAFDVFVSAMQGVDGADCGSRDAACKTVRAGIARAYALGKPKVVIAKGTYVESIPLDGGLTLEGGWEVSGATWTASCNADHSSLAVIQATTDTTVKATRGASVLRFLTLKSKEQAAPGESLYGLVAMGTGVKVALADSAIVVAAGGPGADGAPGSGLTDPPASCPGADGGAGSDGESGDAGALGTIGPNGFVAATGSNGLIGKPGLDGIPGKSTTVTFRPCAWNGGQSAPCAQSGPSRQQTVDGGAPGCGGRAGSGGSGGNGGGSSVGILAVDALIVTYGGTVTTGGGGKGGKGGDGSAGGGGAPPEPSPVFHYDGATTGSCNSPSNSTSRALCEAPLVVTGPAGSAGGNGGNGGAGGGGAGGWSIAYVKLGLSAILASTTTVFNTGDAGAGGPPNGQAGLRQQQWP